MWGRFRVRWQRGASVPVLRVCAVRKMSDYGRSCGLLCESRQCADSCNGTSQGLSPYSFEEGWGTQYNPTPTPTHPSRAIALTHAHTSTRAPAGTSSRPTRLCALLMFSSPSRCGFPCMLSLKVQLRDSDFGFRVQGLGVLRTRCQPPLKVRLLVHVRSRLCMFAHGGVHVVWRALLCALSCMFAHGGVRTPTPTQSACRQYLSALVETAVVESRREPSKTIEIGRKLFSLVMAHCAPLRSITSLPSSCPPPSHFLHLFLLPPPTHPPSLPLPPSLPRCPPTLSSVPLSRSAPG